MIMRSRDAVVKSNASSQTPNELLTLGASIQVHTHALFEPTVLNYRLGVTAYFCLNKILTHRDHECR